MMKGDSSVRSVTKLAITVVTLTCCGLVAQAQAPGMAPQPAPADRSIGFTDAELSAVTAMLRSKQLITQRVLEGGGFSVNVRHITGAETALVHGAIAEVWIVREGRGTLATGGELVDAKPGNGPGEVRGTSIKGGAERELAAGDVVFIPPGVPHGIRQTPSITYLNVRFELTPRKGP